MLDGYRAALSTDTINEAQAQAFLKLISDDKFTGNQKTIDALEEVVDALPSASGLVGKWRQGFLDSLQVAETALRTDPNLSKRELKALAQQTVNGETTAGFADALTSRAIKSVKNPKPGVISSVAKGIGKYGVKALGPLGLAASTAGAANAAQNGSANGHRGVIGAGEYLVRDLVFADEFEWAGGKLRESTGIDEWIEEGPNRLRNRRGFDSSGNLID